MKPTTPAGAGQEALRALRRHRAETKAVIDSGDVARIKRLYADLADDLVAAAEVDGTVAVLSYREVAPVVAERLRTTSGAHLDVGCGPHPLATLELIAGTQRLAVGVDIGFGMVSLARQVAAEVGVTILPVVADAEHLPFRAGTFGSVICDDTLEHVPDDAAAVRELARITRPGGLVALATPNRTRLPVLRDRAADRLRGRRRAARAYFAAETHLREYTWPELERLVGPHLQLVERGNVPWIGSRSRRIASLVTALPGWRRVGRVVLLFLTRRP